MTPNDRPILWVRVGLPGCPPIWPVWMIHHRPPFDGPGWCRRWVESTRNRLRSRWPRSTPC